MTPKKLLILAVTVVVILFGLVIFAYVRLNGQEAQLAAQAEAIAALQEGQQDAGSGGYTGARCLRCKPYFCV